MSIRELSNFDTKIVSGGADVEIFGVRVVSEEGSFADFATDLGSCLFGAVQIDMADRSISLDFVGAANSCGDVYHDIRRAVQDFFSGSPNDADAAVNCEENVCTITVSYNPGAFGPGGFMVTGFGLGDSFGGEPSI